jgi:tetratricopeptide (TPR) repeat protein/tRNA A-37 threonylcarbamoyl transferase component Bud32
MAKLPCPPELWTAFSALLDEALDLAETERARWLASLGPEHDAVRPWLARAFDRRGATQSGDLLKAPVMDHGAPAADDGSSDFFAGQQIGPYRLQSRLGSGGMGEVWLASRSDGTLNRQIALKLPYAHLMAGVLRRRFERERDILAGLSHPHIAQLYDAGVAASQHPYLAMEWIDGVSITEHCRDSKLALARRLDLFLQILDAVGYAHGRLIAHRDLKPSNILVTTKDEQVKLLDFGIAKLLVGDTEPGATQLTRVGSSMATPGYAAPEQLVGEPITAAVDLYALGVILHELLTGRRPERSGRAVRGGGGGSADLPRASSQIEAEHAEFVGRMDARQLRRALSGDLDAIIGKALERDPAQRYRSAEAFARDIEQSREHRPISARHIGAAGVAWKFLRRHRLGVLMSFTLLLTLVGGVAGIAWQAVRAEREAERATTIKDFLIGVFRASDPRIATDKPRGEISARELLDAGARQIESGFASQPQTQLELLGVTADIYRELDETRRSTALYARETELAEKYFGAADSRAIDGLLGQAFNADADGDDARSLYLLGRADPLIRLAHLDNSATRARWLLMDGEALMGDAAQRGAAQQSLEAAAALFERAAPRDPRYPDALTDLGSLSLDGFQYGRSAGYYRQAIVVAQRNSQLQGDLLLAYAGLALALKYLDDFDGSAQAFARGADIAAHTYGLNSNHYWTIAGDWARFRYERGERSAALGAFSALLQNLPGDRDRFRNATDTFEAAQVLRKYGYCLAVDGQGALSAQLLKQARDLLGNSGPHPNDALHLQLDLGRAYQADGRYGEAREVFTGVLNMLQSSQAPPSLTALAYELWGRFLLSQKDWNGAADAFNQVLSLAQGRNTESALYARAGLALAQAARGDVRAALAASAVAMDLLEHIEGYYDVRVEPYVWGVRAQALLSAGDLEAARALAVRTHAAVLRYYAPNSAAFAAADALLKNIPSRALR